MKRLITLLLLFAGLGLKAQQLDSIKTNPTDSPSFIRSKKMSDSDLAKKKEGTFITGIPDFSSDPVTGFGLGLRSNIYWNGNRDNPLFPYTPYLMRLKANAAYYTSMLKNWYCL